MSLVLLPADPDASARGVRERAVGYFLAPAAARPAAAALVPPAARAVVLGPAPDALPLAAALALSLRAAARSHTALVAVWPAEELVRAAATRAAARLAERLSTHGLPAVARGRLAWLALPVAPAAAAAAVRRSSATVDGPLVTALTGPRPAELEGLVAEHDVAVVAADPETALARAALARLVEQGIAAHACAPLRRGLPRTLALAGLAAPRLEGELRATRLAAPPHPEDP